MFEKEADEYADEQVGCGDGYYEWTDVSQAFQKGAEFGYNKGKEWHKPNEKLPKDCSLVLAYGFDDKDPSLYYYVGSDTWEWMPRRIVFLDNSQIRLWKEIVPPKESENEERKTCRNIQR